MVDCPQGMFDINWQNDHLLIEHNAEHYLVDTGSPISLSFEGERRRVVEERLTGHSVDHLLGMDYLGSLYERFDARTLTIQKEPFDEPRVAVPVRRIMGGIPVVKIRAGNTSISAILDTGAQISYFPDDFGGDPVNEVEDYILMLDLVWRTPVRAVLFSLAGEDLEVRAGKLPAELDAELSRHRVSAIIGSEVIRQCGIILAMPEKKLGLIPGGDPLPTC